MGIRLTTSFRNLHNKLYQVDIHDSQFAGSFDVKYGLLYNWYAATDARMICASGWEVPTQTQWAALVTYLGGNTVACGKLKEIGITYWISQSAGCTNESNFNGRGAGYRLYSSGEFTSIKSVGTHWTITENAGNYYEFELRYGYDNMQIAIRQPSYGHSLRLIRTSTILTHGQTGTYTGNDGKVYRTICIGTQEWLADNLAETKYRDSSYVPGYDGGVYTLIDNTAWAALTTGALCAFNNDWSNV